MCHIGTYSTMKSYSPISSKHKQSGLTLVELMVALLIGLILMWGVAQIFISNRQTYSTVDGLARLQENGQYALNLITREIRMAGYYPNPYGKAGNKAGFEAKAFGTNAQGKPVAVIEATNNGSGSDKVTTLYYTDGTDCLGGNTNLSAAVDTAMQGTFPGGAVASIAKSEISTDGTSLLCNGTKVVDGIEHLEIRYGVDSDGDGRVDSFTNAPADPTSVLAVKVALLASTEKQVRDDLDTATYDLLGETVGPQNDRRLRRVYTTTIKLRNRCAKHTGTELCT